MSVFHAEDVADDALAELVADEMSNVDNDHLAFRGNSIATKAMEAYIKLVGGGYLRTTLQSVVNEIIQSEVDLEVDPSKV
jgi:RAS protein activator-like 2